jgi:RND superfamily putative drug exporter
MPAYAQGGTALVSALSTYDIDETGAQRQVDHLRDLPAPQGMTTSVGGTAATLTDLKGSIETRGPLMIGFIAVAMFVVLFLVFGSVTLPLKAILMNTLSLSATYGAMVWIFQDGRLEGLLRYESLGTVDATNPILMFAIVFGLSMDYEVLLLSRVREEFNRTGDNTLAVARGLEKTGRLITSAALLLVVVIAAFATSGVIFVKEMGVGMALAIALDATIVRALLVPALMRLMGKWNWWSPQPLASLWRRVGVGDLEGHARELPAGAGGGGAGGGGGAA